LGQNELQTGLSPRGKVRIYTFYSTIAIGLLSLGASMPQQFLPKIIARFASGPKAHQKVIHSFFWSMLGVGGGLLALAVAIIVPLLMLL